MEHDIYPYVITKIDMAEVAKRKKQTVTLKKEENFLNHH